MEQRVEFKSSGETIQAVLRRPEGLEGDVPLVIMAGGWCYTKEIVMPHYSKFFEEIGCATLAFDYRNFGESTGSPRQHVDPWEQIEDYRNAISFARTLPDIDHDKTGIWGISYSGGHVLIVSALDNRPAFAISTIPVIDGKQTMRRTHGEARFGALNALIAGDRERRFSGQQGEMMPMSPEISPHNELTTWPFPHVREAFMMIKANEAPLHEHVNTIHSTELLLSYRAIPYAKEIYDTPVLMTLAHGDNITSADLEVDAFNNIPNPRKELVSVRGVDHMSIYRDVAHLGVVARVQQAWLKRFLGSQ
ncbi:alpha/beta hydrolase [Sphingobium sp. HWE2-09]|uniref:alpha/beta hydrolase n=1 Tax=Sphingobium sp. HWE2-09 TaxID=3108390 RepID=UPI002DCF7C64|nr:CocE/NonD family hydrolase [Sphingobium sp. HWE2-09]